MGGGYVVDQLHDKDSFSYAGASEKTDFTALCVGADQVYDLDTGLQDLRCGHLLLVSGSRTMDGPVLFCLGSGHVVHGIAQKVEHSSQAFLAHGYLDGAAGIQGFCSADQSVGGVHGDAAHGVVTGLLGHLRYQSGAVIINLNGVEKGRQFIMGEPDIQNRADDLHYLANMFFSHC